MDRIKGADTILLAAGKQGFRSKDTQVGVPGTVVTAKWANDTQEEICGLIESSGDQLDAARQDQLARAIQSGALNYAAAGGSANALTVTLTPAPKAYVKPLPLWVLIATTNTAAATVNVNGLGAKSIVRLGGGALQAGDLSAGALVCIAYDGAKFQIISSTAPLFATAQEVLDATVTNKSIAPNTIAAAVQADAWNYAPIAAGGSGNLLVATLTRAPSLAIGLGIRFFARLTNTGAVTISINGGAEVPVTKQNGNPLQASDLLAGSGYSILYSSGSFRLISPSPSDTPPFATAQEVLDAQAADKIVAPKTIAPAVQADAWNYATIATGGTGDALVATLKRDPGNFAAGLGIRFFANYTNKNAVTIAVNGKAAVPVVKQNGNPLQAGDLLAGSGYSLLYSSSTGSFRLISPSPSDSAHVGQCQVFTASGNFVVPAGVTAVLVRVLAGGGAGGGSPTSSTAIGAGGGAAGGYAEKWCAVTPGQTIAVTVGAGGTCTGPGVNGTAGQSSSFGSYCSATGGQYGASNGTTFEIGGVGVGGDINLNGNGGQQGQSGNNGTGTQPMGAPGGAPPFGGGATSNTWGQGYDAKGYGAGGGGAGGTTNRGGNGAPGLVIVQW